MSFEGFSLFEFFRPPTKGQRTGLRRDHRFPLNLTHQRHKAAGVVPESPVFVPSGLQRAAAKPRRGVDGSAVCGLQSARRQSSRQSFSLPHSHTHILPHSPPRRWLKKQIAAIATVKPEQPSPALSIPRPPINRTTHGEPFCVWGRPAQRGLKNGFKVRDDHKETRVPLY